jgi:hypothetical protein
MRGDDDRFSHLFSYVSPEQLVERSRFASVNSAALPHDSHVTGSG